MTMCHAKEPRPYPKGLVGTFNVLICNRPCLVCNSLISGRILKYFGTSVCLIRMTGREKETCFILKVYVALAVSVFICMLSCPCCNSLIHRRILKQYGTSVQHIKMMCHVKEPHPDPKGQCCTCSFSVLCILLCRAVIPLSIEGF